MKNTPIPPLRTLIFHVTAQCNLNCRHCWQFQGQDKRPDHENGENKQITGSDLSRILEEARTLGLGMVKFTGGEPFLEPLFLDYLNACRDAQIGAVIETNGTLIEKDHIPTLKALEPSQIAVSLDGFSASIHDSFRRLPGAHEKTLTALDLLASHQFPIQIIACIHRGNRHELEDMARLAAQYRVRSVKFNPIQPMGQGHRMTENGECLSVSEMLELAHQCRHGLKDVFSGEIHFDLPLSFTPLDDIKRRKYAVCRIFSILGLLPNGDLSFCGIGQTHPELVFGSIFQDSLKDVWNRAPLLSDLRSCLPDRLQGICGRCLLKAVCLGDCRAAAYDRTGSLMGPHWICEQAYDENVFPTGRLIPGSVQGIRPLHESGGLMKNAP